MELLPFGVQIFTQILKQKLNFMFSIQTQSQSFSIAYHWVNRKFDNQTTTPIHESFWLANFDIRKNLLNSNQQADPVLASLTNTSRTEPQ